MRREGRRIDVAGGGEEELSDACLTAGFEHVERPTHIQPIRVIGIVLAKWYVVMCCHVNDGVRFDAGNEGVQSPRVEYVQHMQPRSTLLFRPVIPSKAQIVDDVNLMLGSAQIINDRRSDESAASCYEDLLQNHVSNQKWPSSVRTQMARSDPASRLPRRIASRYYVVISPFGIIA
jgi:hypothetical protein